ncbi:hypothetical protein NP493_139g02037 [Ridgeia piscesae]|uniref:Uncharacterized protein n=1 Tax=Ridgeia piscesae TaxID=27915 RepID=A0AAD9P4Z1_RIDPI|nr:hypothetical protein NP493_139g02037 [Ridgeia piscesae]
MSDLISSLSHYHRHIAIYVVQIIDTMLSCMCLLRDLRFTLLYVVVSISTCLAQTGCAARNTALFIISQDRQTQVLAAIAMATTIIID